MDVFKLLSAKTWNFVFFVRRKITDACLFVFCLFVVVFFSGGRIDPDVKEYRERAHSN